MMLLSLLLCLLLCGCAQTAPPSETLSPEQALSQEVPSHLQEAARTLELRYGDSLQVTPLGLSDVQGIRATEDGLLVFSGHGSTTLTHLTGEALTETASTALTFELDPRDPSLRIQEDCISFYDPDARAVVALDLALQPLDRIPLGEDLLGSPLLSADRKTVYYCTGTALRALEVESGIHRCVKELSYSGQELTGLHMEDTVLQCRILDGGNLHTLFLSAQTGQVLKDIPRDISLESLSNRYYASFTDGIIQSLVFGEDGSAPQALQPENLNAPCTFLPRQHAAVTVSSLSEGEVQLDYFSLDSGVCQASLPLDSIHYPASIAAGNGDEVFLMIYDPESDCQFLCRWDAASGDVIPASAAPSYTGTYYSAETPDSAGLAQCQAYAEEIGQQHGIDILVWKDAAAVQPWDYVFEAEYVPRILMEELALLQQRLDVYPEGFLAQTASHFSSLKICLVRKITGSPESGSLDLATGIQFFDGSDAYVVIAIGEYAEHALYHELFHVMETRILNETSAFDRWEALNPAGFSYDFSYLTNATRDSGVYLSGENRAFIDTYSMSYPKEDRARLMEYAILPGKEALFQSNTMQRKLEALCGGIREAYGLEGTGYIWEQYLQ